MKKHLLMILSMMLVFCLSLSLFSCGSDETTGSSESSVTSSRKKPSSDKSKAPSNSDTEDKLPPKDEPTEYEYAVNKATDYEVELYSIGVKKDAYQLLDEVNAVIDLWVADGTMEKYIEYYTMLDLYYNGKISEEPSANGLKTTWDFDGATESIAVFTSTDYAPFEFVDFRHGGQIVGVDIAIMSQVAQNMGKYIDIKDVDFDTIAFAVQNSQGDAVGAAAITINEHRLEYMNFSNTYSDGCICLTSISGEYASLDDVHDKRVGIIDNRLIDYAKDTAVFGTVKDLYNALNNGEIDAIITWEFSTDFAAD